MQHDIEKDWGLVDSKEGLEKNKVPRTADGQKFRYSLNDSEKDSLVYIDLYSPLLLGRAPKPVTQFDVSNVKSPRSNVKSNPNHKCQRCFEL